MAFCIPSFELLQIKPCKFLRISSINNKSHFQFTMSLQRMMQMRFLGGYPGVNQAVGVPSNTRHFPRGQLNTTRLYNLHQYRGSGIPSTLPRNISFALETRRFSNSTSTSRKNPGQGPLTSVPTSRGNSLRSTQGVTGTHHRKMSAINQSYPVPNGCHVIPTHLLDLRPDAEIDESIRNPPPVTSSEKNIWFYWSTGYDTMHNCTKRTVRSWYRRFSKQGWTIRVVNRAARSPSNVENFLDTQDPTVFPRAFIDGT